ncbi:MULTISPECIES: CoA transferase subunit A [Vibrio]|uniref:Butyrate--acetoacetate CoA-transferase subunit A n=1 Tax=Vibrio harveyi TaxID=669 RepID=A0A3A1PXR2_VIBHA|nr:MULTISPECIES: CoA transferase subunit A [Vibrio]APP09051.1 branched-chain amino acid dehydrogenase [Vibrio harveyi]EKM30894.1 butyrate--acetoacetate CoA-transferase subunit A [Vibrio harveyi]KNY46430.1 branched-chain amino acid dehydrogenase [Vibrio harveyi]RIW03985.1 CoA transferase subunit A [Vibrio harveyi]WCP84125.1 CoA transferase subunit A [Vibrio harveyi]
MKKAATTEQIESLLHDGMTIMIGGFMATGAPERLIDLLIKKDIKNITLISTDTGSPGRGSSRLIAEKRVKKLYASHIGTNPETGKQMNEGTLEVELVPQGTLAERIRSAGAGLGGVLTPTGLGTIVAENKRVIEIDGKQYLLEMPLKADLALIRGSKVDRRGNVFYSKTTQNFNPLMATAAETVVVEPEQIVELGDIEPEAVHTPSLYVDYILVEDN